MDMAHRHIMMQERWEAVWERSRAGRHTVVVGPHTLPLAPHDDDAVALLTNSITLNFEKGSPVGLAFNRQTLGALAKAATQAHSPSAEKLRGALADVEGRLAQASQSSVG